VLRAHERAKRVDAAFFTMFGNANAAVLTTTHVWVQEKRSIMKIAWLEDKLQVIEEAISSGRVS